MRYSSALRVATLALLWGSGFLWIKLSLRGLTPTQLLFTRLTLGALVLLLVLRLRGERLPTGHATWLHLTGAALFGNVIPYLLFAVGEQQVDSAVAGMLNTTTPLWTLVLAAVAGRDHRPTASQLLGMALGLAGTVLIFAPWNSGTQFTSRGALACLLAAFSYAISYIYMARFLTGKGIGPVALSAGQMLTASVLALLALPAYNGLSIPQWRPDALASIVILGILGTGIAYIINYQLIADDGPVVASVVIYLLPVVAVILGALVLNEQVTTHAIAGVAVVLAGVAIARRKPLPAT